MTRTRVLQVIWRLSRSGGAQTVARSFLAGYDRTRFDVHLCTIRPLFSEDGVDDLGGGIVYHPLSLTGTATPALRMRAARGIARVVRQVQPDVLHVHGGTASYSLPAAFAQRGGARLIEVHDEPQSGRMSKGNRLVERLMVRRLHFRPVTHSVAVRDKTAAAWDLDPRDIDLVPLGVDVAALSQPATDRRIVRCSLGVGERVPLITYLGRLVPEKRPDLFVQVAARVVERCPDAVFAFVGEGSSRDAAQDEALRLGVADHVLLPGYVDDRVSLYHASDVFLSTSRYEGFGLAIAEAMAAGVPIVSTLVGGVGDVVGDAGILEPSEDPDRIADHVLCLLDDPARRAALGRAAAVRARKALDVRDSVDAFEDVYDRLGAAQ